MNTTVIIKNLKCNDCKSAVTNLMLTVEGVSDIRINLIKNEVSFNYTTHNVLEGLRETLSEQGFPITKDPNTISNKVISFLLFVKDKIGLLSL